MLAKINKKASASSQIFSALLQNEDENACTTWHLGTTSWAIMERPEDITTCCWIKSQQICKLAV
jgi:hypothetical protein